MLAYLCMSTDGITFGSDAELTVYFDHLIFSLQTTIPCFEVIINSSYVSTQVS